jgi:hypothetical protein
MTRDLPLIPIKQWVFGRFGPPQVSGIDAVVNPVENKDPLLAFRSKFYMVADLSG